MKVIFDFFAFFLFFIFYKVAKFRLINFRFFFVALRGFRSEYLYFKFTNTCVLQFYYVDCVRFYPLGYKSYFSLQNSFNNYMIYSHKTSFFNYKYEAINDHYCCELLEKLPSNLLFRYDPEVLEESRIDPNEFKCICKIFLEKFYIKIDSFKIFNEILYYKFEKGFVHGDLTPDNVMLNRFGEFVFIDLDRCFSPGPLLFDRLHFFVESKREKKNWLEFLSSLYHDGTFNQFEVFFYLIYRLYLEFNCSLYPSFSLRKKVSNFLEVF